MTGWLYEETCASLVQKSNVILQNLVRHLQIILHLSCCLEFDCCRKLYQRQVELLFWMLLAQCMLRHPAIDSVCRGPPACGHIISFICRGFPSPMRVAVERPEFDIAPPFGAPLLICPWGYLLMSFPQGDTSARQGGIWNKSFLYHMWAAKGYWVPPAHLPVIPLATHSYQVFFDYVITYPIMVTAFLSGFPGESFRSVTGGFACYCPVPEVWASEASWQNWK